MKQEVIKEFYKILLEAVNENKDKNPNVEQGNIIESKKIRKEKEAVQEFLKMLSES